MILFGGHPRPPGFGRLPRGLAVAAISAVTVVPLAASAAAAAPPAPTAYTVYGIAEPLFWGGSKSAPVGELRVPFVRGKTNNLATASSGALLGLPDGDTTKPMSGESISGLTCQGFDEKLCKDPFTPVADADHKGTQAGRAEKVASFGGKDGKFPGRVSAVTDCAGNCGDQLIRSTSDAVGPAGGYAGYVTVGSSSASHDLSIDDKGRLVSTARSALENVTIGSKPPNGPWPVQFSSLVTTAHASGTGAENAKDGRADLRITDFFVMGYPVELTRAGLRTVGGASEQAAYDNGKALLKQLRKDHGIVLELPDFDAQLVKSPAHVAVESLGLRVRFEQSVGSVNASAISYPIELGRATAVVAALDADRNIEVNENPDGGVTVETTAPTTAPAAGPGGGGTSDTKAAPPKSAGGTNTKQPPATSGGGRERETPGPSGTTAPATPVSGEPPAASAPADPGAATGVDAATPATGNPDETALSLRDVERKLGLRGAQSVSRAFGAFLGLGLILPLARFVIRRFG